MKGWNGRRIRGDGQSPLARGMAAARGAGTRQTRRRVPDPAGGAAVALRPTPVPTCPRGRPAAHAVPVRLDESVVVQAVRAEERTPVTQDRRRPRGDRAREPRPGDAVPARRDAVGDVQSDSGIAAGYAYFNLRGIQPDAAQHHPRRRAAERPRGLGALLLGLRRLRERRRLHPGPARRRHLERAARPRSAGRSTSRASTPARSRRSRRRSAAARGAPARGTLGRRAPAGSAPSRSTAASRRRRPTASATTRASTSTPSYFGATRQGEPLALQALRLLGPREDASSPSWPTDEATLETGPARTTPSRPTRRTDFGQDFVQAAVHAPRRRVDDADGAGLLQRRARAGSASATRRAASLQQYGIDGHFVGLVLGATHRAGAPRPQLGRARQRLHARPLHGRGRAARAPTRTPASRTSTAPS